MQGWVGRMLICSRRRALKDSVFAEEWFALRAYIVRSGRMFSCVSSLVRTCSRSLVVG